MLLRLLYWSAVTVESTAARGTTTAQHHATALTADTDWSLTDLLGGVVSEQSFLDTHWQQRPLYIGNGSSEHVSKIRRLLSLASLEALTHSPAFNHRMRDAIDQIAGDGVDSQRHWWEPGAMEPLSVHGTGFKQKSLQTIGALHRQGSADYADVHAA